MCSYIPKSEVLPNKEPNEAGNSHETIHLPIHFDIAREFFTNLALDEINYKDLRIKVALDASLPGKHPIRHDSQHDPYT